MRQKELEDNRKEEAKKVRVQKKAALVRQVTLPTSSSYESERQLRKLATRGGNLKYCVYLYSHLIYFCFLHSGGIVQRDIQGEKGS